MGSFCGNLRFGVNAGPIIVVALIFGGRNGPYRLIGNTPGIFILLNSSLKFKNLSNVLIALC